MSVLTNYGLLAVIAVAAAQPAASPAAGGDTAACTMAESDALTACGTDFGTCTSGAGSDQDKLCDCLNTYNSCILKNLCGPDDFQKSFKDALASACSSYEMSFGCSCDESSASGVVASVTAVAAVAAARLF